MLFFKENNSVQGFYQPWKNAQWATVDIRHIKGNSLGHGSVSAKATALSECKATAVGICADISDCRWKIRVVNWPHTLFRCRFDFLYTITL